MKLKQNKIKENIRNKKKQWSEVVRDEIYNMVGVYEKEDVCVVEYNNNDSNDSNNSSNDGRCRYNNDEENVIWFVYTN